MTRPRITDLVAMALAVPCPACKVQPDTVCLSEFKGLAVHHERIAAGKRHDEALPADRPVEPPAYVTSRGTEFEPRDVTDEHWPFYTQQPYPMTADVSWCSEHTRFEWYGRVPNLHYTHPVPKEMLP